MRTTVFNSVDDAVQELAKVVVNHKGGIPLMWGYSKSVALEGEAERYIGLVNKVLDEIDLHKIPFYSLCPSEYVKLAYRYCLTSKSVECNKDIIAHNYLKLFNMGVAKQKFIEDEYKDKIKSMDLIYATPELRRKIAFVNADVRALSELMYCDEHTIAGQISGPYFVNGNTLLIHDFNRLRPIGLYPFLEEYEIDSIRTYCLYSDNSICADMLGNISFSGNVNDTLVSFCIEIVDRNQKVRLIDSSEINKIIEYLDSLVIVFTKLFKNFNEYDTWKLTLKCEYYAFKPLLDDLSIYWWEYDDKELMNRFSNIKDGYYSKYLKNTSEINSQEEVVEYVTKLIDPRIK